MGFLKKVKPTIKIDFDKVIDLKKRIEKGSEIDTWGNQEMREIENKRYDKVMRIIFTVTLLINLIRFLGVVIPWW